MEIEDEHDEEQEEKGKDKEIAIPPPPPQVIVKPSYDRIVGRAPSHQRVCQMITSSEGERRYGVIKYRNCLKNHASRVGSHEVDGCDEFMAAGIEGTLDALRCAACGCHRNFHRKEIDISGGSEIIPPPANPSPVPATTPHNQLLSLYPQFSHQSSGRDEGECGGAAHAQHHHQYKPLAVVTSSLGETHSGDITDEMSHQSCGWDEGKSGGAGGGVGTGVMVPKKRYRTKFTQEQKDKMLVFAEKLGWRIQKHDEAAVQEFCAEVQVAPQVFKCWMHNNNTLGYPTSAVVTSPLTGASLKDKGLARDLFPFLKVGIRTPDQLVKRQDAVKKETLLGEHKNKMNSKWTSLAQALRAIMNMRILNRQKLYCCLFPSDYEIERETLVQLWMGLLQQPWEDNANSRFDRLLNDNYIYKSRTDILTGINKYKIDADKVTSHFNMVKNRDHYTMLGDENVGVDISKAWHVSVASKSIDETVFKTLEGSSGLRSVLFIHDYGSSLKRIPSTFFTTLPYMQALDLSGGHISELPSSIGNMTHLYFLDLSFTLIERIPESIRLLQELQTLKLRGCKHLHTLPKGMKELVNLYHLDFDVLGQLTSMPKGLGSLTRLRMLSAFIVSEEDGCSLRELKDMNNLCGSLCISGLEYATREDAMNAAMRNKMHLTRLHFKWNDSKCYNEDDRNLAYSTLQSLCPHYSSLVELQISYYPGYTLPTWIQHPQLMHLVSITFLKCENETLIVPERLPNLRHINIYEMNRVTNIGSKGYFNVARSFPKLETLTIDGMLNLQGLTKVQVGDYPCLSKVSMKRCPKLTELPALPLLGSLTYLEISHCKSIESLPEGKLPILLETLMIDNCPLLKPRCSKGGEDWEKIKHVPNIWIDMKDIRHEDTDSLSEDEYESSDDSD